MTPANDGNTQDFASEAESASGDSSPESGPAEGSGSEAATDSSSADSSKSGGDAESEKLREERDYYLDQVQRTMAEFENFRRRVGREREQTSRRITADLFRQVLPIHDDLQLAVQSESDLDDSAAAKLRDGLKLIASKFDQLLSENNVEQVPSVGEMFDPALHEAMFQEETSEAPEGQILEVFERGYQLGDELIRPARVKVAKAKSGE